MLSLGNAVYRFLGCLSSCELHVPSAIIVNDSGDLGRVCICGESARKNVTQPKKIQEYNVFSSTDLVTPLTSGTNPGSSILIPQHTQKLLLDVGKVNFTCRKCRYRWSLHRMQE